MRRGLDRRVMGPGGAVDAVRAASQGSALRAWGEAIAGAVCESAPELSSLGLTAFQDGVQRLRPVSKDLVHTVGWELRDAFVWRNDNRCIQRAAFGALSLAQREAGGDLHAAVGQLARNDAMAAAMAVTYTPSFGNARLHSAVIARTTDDELLVIDHLFADAPDGVLPLEEWMRRSGATESSSNILSPLVMPPWSQRGGAGIPVRTRAHRPAEWSEFADHLASSWRESADFGLPQHERVHR